ncbi:MAG: hypothetical protein K8F91_09500 [Candidatus Obscuribacterales bacterium]|nr:hypothetical protein [Candidatus Obscuribacterales bacterium]
MPDVSTIQTVSIVLAAITASALTIYATWNSPGKGKFLCQDCRFNNPKDCLKEEKPMAIDCTSYRPISTSRSEKK